MFLTLFMDVNIDYEHLYPLNTDDTLETFIVIKETTYLNEGHALCSL